MYTELMLGKLLPIDELKYPCLMSIKYDGIQAITVEPRKVMLGKKEICTGSLSRNYKPIRNAYVRDYLSQMPRYLQGELVLPGQDFSTNASGLTKFSGQPDFHFKVFNYFGRLDLPYQQRMSIAAELIAKCNSGRVSIVDNVTMHSREELNAEYAFILALGYEGAMVTYADAPYIGGRSPYLVKLKHHEESEFEIVGFMPEYYADTESNKAHGLVGKAKDKLGALICKIPDSDVTFRAGCGFTDEYGAVIWNNKQDYIGHMATIKYLKSGTKTRPRHPIAKAVRNYE